MARDRFVNQDPTNFNKYSYDEKIERVTFVEIRTRTILKLFRNISSDSQNCAREIFRIHIFFYSLWGNTRGKLKSAKNCTRRNIIDI